MIRKICVSFYLVHIIFCYWNNKNLYEIDLILESGNKTTAIEIKSGMTLQKEYLKNLKYWQKLSGESPENCYVIYGGKEKFSTGKGSFVSWQYLDEET